VVLSKLFENIHKYIDLKFKPTVFSPGKNNKNEKNSLLKPKNAGTNLKAPKRSFATRQSPLYDNCYMQAPDGVLLCTCDKKKADW
jgi:exonuclease 3'-5' domain-containing protein 2